MTISGEGAEEQWAETFRGFVEVTDEMCQLRQDKVAAEFIRLGLDYDAALSGFDAQGGAHMSAEAEEYEELIEQAIGDESDIATQLTQTPPYDQHLRIISTGAFMCSQTKTDKEPPYMQHDLYFTRYEKIAKISINTSPGEWGPVLSKVMSEGLNAAAIPVEEMELTEAQSMVRMLKVIRRYAGEILYGRQPLPNDSV